MFILDFNYYITTLIRVIRKFFICYLLVMKITLPKALGIAGVWWALFAVGAFSAVFAYFSPTPAPAGCTDTGYGYQGMNGYGYEVTCPTTTTSWTTTSWTTTSWTTTSWTSSSSSSSWWWWGSGGSVSRDFCPSGDMSGDFRDGRCEAFVGDSTDGTAGTTTASDTTSWWTTTAGWTTTAWGTTGGLDIPLSFAELIKKRNEANDGGVTTPTWNPGLWNSNLPAMLPNTGAVN